MATDDPAYDPRALLHNVCRVCGQLYYWCPHRAGYAAGTDKQARAALARTLLAYEFEPDSTNFKNSESEIGLIQQVFGRE
jgi:hypothetical protein